MHTRVTTMEGTRGLPWPMGRRCSDCDWAPPRYMQWVYRSSLSADPASGACGGWAGGGWRNALSHKLTRKQGSWNVMQYNFGVDIWTPHAQPACSMYSQQVSLRPPPPPPPRPPIQRTTTPTPLAAGTKRIATRCTSRAERSIHCAISTRTRPREASHPRQARSRRCTLTARRKSFALRSLAGRAEVR